MAVSQPKPLPLVAAGQARCCSPVVDPWFGLSRSGRGSSFWRREALQALECVDEDILRRTGAGEGKLDARTLTVTTAPIFNNLRRIDPAVALAISVRAKPRRRTASTST